MLQRRDHTEADENRIKLENVFRMDFTLCIKNRLLRFEFIDTFLHRILSALLLFHTHSNIAYHEKSDPRLCYNPDTTAFLVDLGVAEELGLSQLWTSSAYTKSCVGPSQLGGCLDVLSLQPRLS